MRARLTDLRRFRGLMAAVAMLVLLAVPALRAASLLAQERRSAVSQKQVESGRTTYAAICAACHRPDLAGNGDALPLTGAGFQRKWRTRTVADLYRLQDQRAEIRLQLDPALGDIEADRGRLRQVLANLISNALHAISGAELGVVEIATQLRQGAGVPADVQLQVSDNGPGFSAEVLQHAFEPYVTSKARGTGLGLAIVKRIVEEHAGQVEAGNQPQGGAVVRIQLPLRTERRAEPRRERA